MTEQQLLAAIAENIVEAIDDASHDDHAQEVLAAYEHLLSDPAKVQALVAELGGDDAEDMALPDDAGIYHGPQPPGEGWVEVGTGPRGGKMWKRQGGQEAAPQESGGKPVAGATGEHVARAKAVQEYKTLGTKAPAFKAWFGDWENDPAGASKVVNKDGTPKRVYHGTGAEINEFKEQHPGSWDSGFLGSGHYFTSSTKDADWYATNRTPFSKFNVRWSENGDKADVVDRSTGEKVGTFDTFNEADEFAKKKAALNPQVMPVYLSIKKPLVVTQSPAG
jgi:hypothetical protein